MKKKILAIASAVVILFAGIALGTIWSDYDDQTAGNIADVDTFLVRDVSNTEGTGGAATGTQMEYPWSVMLTDLDSNGYDPDSLDGDTVDDGAVDVAIIGAFGARSVYLIYF